MKQPLGIGAPRVASPVRPAGTYVGCAACGRMLRIQWATRSIVCSCGARIDPSPKAQTTKPEPGK